MIPLKINFVCFKFSKIIYLIFCIVLIIITSFGIRVIKLQKKEKNTLIHLALENFQDTFNQKIPYYCKPHSIITSNKIMKKSRIMPIKLKGFEIVGKIEIPKLKLERYILKDTNSKSLKVSVTKLCGPEINEIGNFCIAGHNYIRTFGGLKKLEKNDNVILTDVYGNRVFYKIYDIYKISPKNTSCLNQNTKDKRELTLITCTLGATQRIIIKAIEI